MDQKIIEEIDRRRYRLILWQTVGFAVWYVPFLFLFWGVVKEPWFVGALVLPLLVGVAVFGMATFRLAKVTRQIVSDPKLRAAVNNELFIANEYKATVYGYYSTVIAIVILFCVSIFMDIPGKVMGGILILVCALAGKIAQLVFQRG